jgi:hypothetical protein
LELTPADRHNSPIRLTVALAKQAGLILGQDYACGDSYEANGHTHYTARLLHDPIALSLIVIDRVGFYGVKIPRWNYIAIPERVWGTFSDYQRILTLKSMYWAEGGTALNQLFDDALAFASDHSEEETHG